MNQVYSSSPSSSSGADQRLAKVWTEFCERLAKAGEVLLREQTPTSALDQAEGVRYLSRLTRTALNMFVDSADPDFPRLFLLCDDKIKIGADNPDNLYQQIVVAGDREYRLWGKRNTVPYLSIGSKANRYAVDGTMASTGEVEFSDVQLEPDGSYEIFVGKERKGAKNWLPMADDTTLLIIRQTFEDKATQVAAEINVERIGGPAHPALLTPQQIEAQLNQTSAWVAGTANTFADWSEWFKGSPNKIYEADQSIWLKAGGDPKIWYGHLYYDLAPDEALVLEVTPPKNCRFWNFQADNWWMESLDHVHQKIWFNSSQAKLEADGRVVLVCANKDPGFGNWVDLAGHYQGTALWRWVEADSHPTPTCKVVKI